MPGPDTVAEEAPVLVGLDMALNALIVVLFLWALKTVWRYTLGAILLGIANAVKINVWRVHLDPARKLRDVNNIVLAELDKGIAAAQNAMGFWFHQTARLQLWIADELWKGTRDAFNFGEWLVKTYVPTIAHYAGKIVFPWPTIYRVIDHEIEKFLPKVGHAVSGAKAATEAELAKFERGIDRKLAREAGLIAAFGVTLAGLAGTITWPHGGLSLPKGIGIPHEWWKWRARVNRRLTKLEGIAAAAVMAGLMANVLGVTARCLRSGNVGKVARRLCGLGPRALEDLLGLIVDVVLIADVCQVTRMLNSALTLVEGPITDFVSVAESALCHGDYHAPPALAVAPLSLPPVTGLALSLG